MQSHRDVIQLLPALPAEWRAGAVRGLRARGGFEVDMAWAEGRATGATIRAHATRTCRLQAPGVVRVLANGAALPVVRRGPDGVEFRVTADGVYQVEFRRD